MPQSSFSTEERGNPPPRRKACTGCVRAKRRCNLGVPGCLRCSQRKIECQYPVRSVSDGRVDETVDKQGTCVGENPEFSSMFMVTESELSLELSSWTPQPLAGDKPEPGVPPPLVSCETSEPLDCSLNMLDFIVDVVTPENTPDKTVARVVELPLSQLNPLTYTPPVSGRQACLISTRFQYAIDEIIKAPETMLSETGTSWCHPCLYKDGMPRSMQDAYACCGLYAAKTPTNATTILRIINARAQGLAASPIPTAPLDLLAHTQALLLYQIMRLFDNDIRATGPAEAANPALEAAAVALLEHTSLDHPYPSNPGGPGDTAEPMTLTLPLHPLAPTRRFWENWIFQESASRTFLVALFTIRVWCLLRSSQQMQGVAQCGGKLYGCRPWTLAADLWRAADAVEFAVAWGRQRHFVVRDTSLDSMLEVVQDARADELETFGKILLTSLVGIDEAKGWLLTRGGTL